MLVSGVKPFQALYHNIYVIHLLNIELQTQNHGTSDSKGCVYAAFKIWPDEDTLVDRMDLDGFIPKAAFFFFQDL